MKYTINLNSEERVIDVKNSGELDKDLMYERQEEIIELATSKNIKKILCDNTDLIVNFEFECLIEFMNTIPDNLFFAAYINPGQTSMNLKFAEIVASNYNKNARLFSNKNAAMAWLNAN